MKSFKPRIFVGSSKEGIAIARQVKKELSRVADCEIWENQFELGNSALEDLVKNLSLYDFGVLVATGDDSTRSRKIQKLAPRDNIIFEFGLFVGRLGREKTFLMAESGIKIPSDLSGITLPFFSGAKVKQKKQIFECCKKIKAHIKRREDIFDFGFLPSTSLAYGYYNNFIIKAVGNLIQSKTLKLGSTTNSQKNSETKSGQVSKAELDGMKFSDLRFTVLIPTSLAANMFDHIKSHRQKNNWDLIKIDAGGFRPFDFHIHAKESRSGILQLSDLPITLNALGESIRAYIGKSYVGISTAEALLEQRELRIFKNVLDYLISENPITKNRVKTEIVDA